LCHDLALKPFFGRRRVAIIDDADYLNEEGANALLKTLEEPPPQSILILIGTSAATVRDSLSLNGPPRLSRWSPDAPPHGLVADGARLPASGICRRQLQRADLADEICDVSRAALEGAGPATAGRGLGASDCRVRRSAGKEAPARARHGRSSDCDRLF
jgi:hypothetical protein